MAIEMLACEWAVNAIYYRHYTSAGSVHCNVKSNNHDERVGGLIGQELCMLILHKTVHCRPTLSSHDLYYRYS